MLDKVENEYTGIRFWVRKIFQERKKYVLYHILTDELRLFDKEYFFRFVRMTLQRFRFVRITLQRFEYLLPLVGTHLQQTTTKMREPIFPAERFVLTLRFLASGDSQQSLCFSFRISRAAICTILSETCEKLWVVLSSSYVRKFQWKQIVAELAGIFIECSFKFISRLKAYDKISKKIDIWRKAYDCVLRLTSIHRKAKKCSHLI